MKRYKIAYVGTVTGEVRIYADSLEEAIKISKDEPVDLLDYPDDWQVNYNECVVVGDGEA